MGYHDLAIPLRFLALLGHFFAVLIALSAMRDNVLVTLPFTYTEDALDTRMYSARAALILALCVIAVNAVGFFGGFSTFDIAMSLFHMVAHGLGSILFALVVINKAHYLYLWYIVIFFSVPQLLCELYAFGSVLLLQKRRW